MGDAPYFVVHLRSQYFEGFVWFLVDTGASRTTLLNRDVHLLNVPVNQLTTKKPVSGIGGIVSSFIVSDVKLTLPTQPSDYILSQDIALIQHDTSHLNPTERTHLMRLPSAIGRDVINQFQLSYVSKASGHSPLFCLFPSKH